MKCIPHQRGFKTQLSDRLPTADVPWRFSAHLGVECQLSRAYPNSWKQKWISNEIDSWIFPLHLQFPRCFPQALCWYAQNCWVFSRVFPSQEVEIVVVLCLKKVWAHYTPRIFFVNSTLKKTGCFFQNTLHFLFILVKFCDLVYLSFS